MANAPHHLIFEGPELSGKSYLMHGVYDFLEVKYNQNRGILDGCHWFNCDVGIFGTEHSRFCIEKYVEMLEEMKEKNVLFEKFHISDIVYQQLYNNKVVMYDYIEKGLQDLNVKIILCTVSPETAIFEKRIEDRLKLYPHYQRILKDPEWYIEQQKKYKEEISRTNLEYLEVDMTEIPNLKSDEILSWIGEK